MPLGSFRLNGLAKFTVTAVAEVIRAKKGITAIGNAQVSTAQSKFGGASALFDGTGDYLRVEPKIEVASSNFTMEAWIRTSDNAQRIILAKFSAAYSAGFDWTFFQSSTGKLIFQWWDGGFKAVTGATTLSLNTWIHVAAVRNGSTLTLYVNGVADATGTATDIRTGTAEVWVGAYSEGSGVLSSWNGNLDEIRISNSARYTANFTAPTQPFVNDANTLLLIHANGTNASTYFEDDNGQRGSRGITAIGNAQIDTAQSKFGGASALFDGNGDYLLSPTNSAFGFGTGDFTIEGWIRFNNFTSGPVFVDMRSAGGTEVVPTIYFNTNGAPIYFTNGSARITGSNLSTGTWHHIAVSRSGTSTRMFVNGTQVGSTYSDSNNYVTTLLSIGIVPYNTSFGALNGWIDELRVSNSARYTANFTPATTPFVNDANTLLLLHMDGTDATTVFTDDNGVRSPKGIAANGNAQVDTAQSKFGGASALFDGSGDYLVVSNGGFNWGTGDFTVEAWVRHAVINDQQVYWDFRSGDSDQHIFYIKSNNTLEYYDGAVYTSTTTLAANTWYHLALSRSSGTIKLFINGTQEWSNANTRNHSNTASIHISNSVPALNTNCVNGYMDEIRVSNSARYTANFTADRKSVV
jgi:hypothetical protein